jgi:hypothetical protein
MVMASYYILQRLMRLLASLRICPTNPLVHCRARGRSRNRNVLRTTISAKSHYLHPHEASPRERTHRCSRPATTIYSLKASTPSRLVCIRLSKHIIDTRFPSPTRCIRPRPPLSCLLRVNPTQTTPTRHHAHDKHNHLIVVTMIVIVVTFLTPIVIDIVLFLALTMMCWFRALVLLDTECRRC